MSAQEGGGRSPTDLPQNLISERLAATWLVVRHPASLISRSDVCLDHQVGWRVGEAPGGLVPGTDILVITSLPPINEEHPRGPVGLPSRALPRNQMTCTESTPSDTFDPLGLDKKNMETGARERGGGGESPIYPTLFYLASLICPQKTALYIYIIAFYPLPYQTLSYALACYKNMFFYVCFQIRQFGFSSLCLLLPAKQIV